MQCISIDKLKLYFSEKEEQKTVDLIRQACEKSMRLMQKHWELGTPNDCRVYIMSSWYGFVFRSAPWSWKILLALTIPLWANRIKKIWSIAGGWEQAYGQRRAVGIKPPRLIQLADKSIGNRIFIKEHNLDRKVQHITCHELTHAFTSHLKLPTWLKEGLAMVMVEKILEKQTVKPETLEILNRSSENPPINQKLRIEDEDAMVRLYIYGYWLTRYIEETQPELMKDLLSQPYPNKKLENMIVAAYGMKHEEFWNIIDSVLISYFK